MTEETEGLIDADRLARLPADATVVNVGRGGVLDPVALYEALAAGRIHGAGIDVWWRYPDPGSRDDTPAADVPLHQLDNVVLSPHRAAHGSKTEDLRIACLCDLLGTLAAGRRPDARVDVQAGY